ncbi:MAG TPA: hypothetical protein VKY66_03075 [Protaetiibacter sp.]|nr:hypothetical protein [Protaetiibacter sp.]
MGGGRIWLLVGGLVGAVVIGLGWLIGASPLFAQASAADAQRADVEATNAQLEITLAQMRKLDGEKEELLARLDELHETVPTVPNIEDYLDWVATAAARAAVSLPNTSVGTPQLVAIEDGATADFSAGLANSLYVIPVTIDIGGDPAQMNAFVQQLQTDGRLQLLTRVTLNFGTSLSGKLEGYVFVVHDASAGPLLSAGSDDAADADQATEPGAGPTPPPGDAG